MSFDTTTFWIFFVFAWFGWRFLPWGIAKTFTLFCSLLFYGWWNPFYLPLILFSTIIDYVAGKKIFKTENVKTRKIWLAVSLVSNLGLLALFKYGNFAVTNLNNLAKFFKLHTEIAPFQWVIPVGISFYTFQAMSYTIDIYRKRIGPAKNFRDFLLFVTLFPQLVAGPIVRAIELLPQLNKRAALCAKKIQLGIYFIIYGLFLKIVVADNLAPYVEKIFDLKNIDKLLSSQVWLGVVSFSVQIFGDFAGYSYIAIGLACLMGIGFPKNFNYPYISAGFTEFWQRWHITLSRWLRDYVYISFGGNRFGNYRTYCNLMLTMLLGGLWHGASWTFVAWGGLHGVGLCIERFFMGRNRFHPYNAKQKGRIPFKAAAKRLIAIIIVFIFLQVTWVFFRADSFTLAWKILQKMFCMPFCGGFGPFAKEMLCPLVLVSLVLLLHLGRLVYEWFGVNKNVYLLAAFAAVMLFLVLIVEKEVKTEFIYFQF